MGLIIEHEISEHVAERAAALLDEGRVRLASTRSIDNAGQRMYGAVVLGSRGDYEVWFHFDGVTCDCRAGSDHGSTEPRCGHAVAAMVAWHEHMQAAEALS